MTILRVHGTAVRLADAAKPFGGGEALGVLLLGPSGSGKSDVALRLIAGGAQLISDDQTLLAVKDGVVHASAPEDIVGLIELRGVGILRFNHAPPTPIVLAIMLDVHHGLVRLPHAAFYAQEGLEGALPIPLLDLTPFEAATPAKIAAAAVASAQGTLFRNGH